MKKLLIVIAASLAFGACLPYLYTPDDTLERTTHVAGKTREYLLHVPPGYDGSHPVPLVITIHGFSQWPAHQLWLSKWNPLADEQGFIVAYPSGTGFPKRWSMHKANGTQFDAAPDVAFLRRMIGEIARDYRIDASRVYVNGLSNGGGMTYILACELAGQIAAVGFVAGGYMEPNGGCRPARPMPVIAFHGNADPLVPYEGGRLLVAPVPFAPVTAWIADWVARDGCSPAAATSSVTAHVSLAAYSGCRGGSEVHFYTIDGGGHTWPGGEDLPEFFTGATNHEIDASRLMWAFFTKHARAPEPAR